MAYPVERIIPVNIILTQAGLQYADFVSVRAVATADMLAVGATFPVDTYKTYGSLSDVADDFLVTSDVYYMAELWFAQTPKPGAESFQVWMWDDVTDTNIIDTLNKSEDQAKWMYFVAVPTSVYQAQESVALDLAAWADANEHMVPLTFQNSDSLDENITTDIPSVLRDNGARRITQKFRSQSVVDTAARQAYAFMGELAFFQRFNFDGVATSVDPEFKALSNVIGDDLFTSQYTALEDKQLGFYTNIELKGSEVTSRVKNSWTTSSFNETVDDVFSLDVLKNRMQVDGFNYLSARKRGLRRPRDYAGLLQTYEAVARQAYENGTLAGDVPITDPRTGDEVILKHGYLMLSEPEDVQDLTAAQISAREYPPVQMIVVLARSARVAELNITVQ